MTDKQKRNTYIIIAVIVALLLLVGGFFIGRATVKNRTTVKVEYVKLDPIHDTITDLKPYRVILPTDTADIIRKCVEDGIYTELFPTKTITEYIDLTSEDTLAIIRDWAASRYYTETIFDVDTIGKCIVDVKVQYNRIDSLGYTYTPVQKQTTITNYQIKKFSPFVGAGFDINHIGQTPTFDINAEVGFYIKEKYGVAVDYRYDFMDKSHCLGGKLLYKF